MGWTERKAENYKNGKIDRKAELIGEFNYHSDTCDYEVLKCSMRGAVGYMAVKYTNYNNADKNCVFGLVCLTSVRDNFWFGYKDMDETMGPYCYDCPHTILDLLTPTTNETALEWRKKCREKNTTNSIKAQMTKAKEGSTIRVTYRYETNLAEKGDTVIFEKRCHSYNVRTNRRSYQWVTTKGYCYRMSQKMILDNNPEWVNYIE